MRGVNLGNWLVLEKWMNPQLFADTTAPDETNLCRQLDGPLRRERFRAHRATWITERDFAYLANHGFELVRLPIPYFVFGDVEPFVGCIEYVDRAVDWADKYGINVLVDLHTVPGSQNGFDNGGLAGVCTWHTDRRNVDAALDVLERVAARYAGRDAFWGLEVLNEPISPALWELIDVPRRYPAAVPAEAEGSGPVPTDVLFDYYRRAYDRIRAVAPDLRVVFHDGFRIPELIQFLDAADFRNITVDTHQYLMMFTLSAGYRTRDEYVAHVHTAMAAELAALGAHAPVLVGEWSLDTAVREPDQRSLPERRAYYRAIADAQLEVFDRVEAWTYWAYKLLDDSPRADYWDLGRAIELGFFPVRTR